MNKNPIKDVRATVNRKLRGIKTRSLQSALWKVPSLGGSSAAPRQGLGGERGGGSWVRASQCGVNEPLGLGSFGPGVPKDLPASRDGLSDKPAGVPPVKNVAPRDLEHCGLVSPTPALGEAGGCKAVRSQSTWVSWERAVLAPGRKPPPHLMSWVSMRLPVSLWTGEIQLTWLYLNYYFFSFKSLTCFLARGHLKRKKQ